MLMFLKKHKELECNFEKLEEPKPTIFRNKSGWENFGKLLVNLWKVLGEIFWYGGQRNFFVKDSGKFFVPSLFLIIKFFLFV